MLLSASHGLAAVLQSVSICRPISASWDASVNGDCGNEILAYVILESLGLAIDLAILAVPFSTVPTMALPFERKVKTLLVLSAGAM